jgi:hypothetical protein
LSNPFKSGSLVDYPNYALLGMEVRSKEGGCCRLEISILQFKELYNKEKTSAYTDVFLSGTSVGVFT